MTQYRGSATADHNTKLSAPAMQYANGQQMIAGRQKAYEEMLAAQGFRPVARLQDEVVFALVHFGDEDDGYHD